MQYANNTGISDDTTFVFGIRTVSTKAVDVNGTYRRDFYVNEKRVHLTGGAWVPDMMLNSDSTRIRNHPSLLVWTGGNEGHARKELYDAMRESIIKLDGTRPYIPSSSGFARLPEGWDGSWPDNLPTGVYSGGPYTWKDPKDYYDRAIAARDWVFKDGTSQHRSWICPDSKRNMKNLLNKKDDHSPAQV